MYLNTLGASDLKLGIGTERSGGQRTGKLDRVLDGEIL